MRVLVACEFSGRVRDAFRLKGHDAFSCDIIDSEPESDYHIKGNVIPLLTQGWDLLIAFPPCTYLCSSGALYWSKRQQEQQLALQFVKELMNASIEKIAIENPVGIISTKIRKPDQIIQPWMFGHGETKATCLWLKNLPKLIPTEVVDGRSNRIANLPPSKDRAKIRSITYQGVAQAMADQWNF